MKAEAARRPRLVWATGVVVMVLAGLAGLEIFIAKQPYGYDLWAYVLAARHLLAGEPLYAAQPEVPFGPYGEFHYAPPAAVPFVPLAPLPFELATMLFTALSLVVAAAIAVYLIRPLPRDARPWAAAAFVVFLPMILEIALGNLNLITVALCLLAWSLRQRPALTGTILAVAIGLKLLPLTLVLFYLASGRGRVVAWTIAVETGGLVLTAIVFARDFPAYVSLLVALKDSHFAAEVIAGTPPAEVSAILGSPVGRWLPPLASLATAALGGLAARRDPSDETHLHHLALAYAPYLASFAPLWFPYLVTALPLFASTLRRTLATPLATVRAPLVAVLGLAWLLMETFGREDLIPLAAHLVGLALLGAASVVVLTLDRQPESSQVFRPRASPPRVEA